MPQFLSAFSATLIKDGLWKLDKELVYQSDILGTITVPEGFETDLASVPELPFVYLLAGGKASKEAVIHDYLYRTRTGTRKQADDVFLEAMKATSQSWWRRSLMWAGVRLFGWTAYKG